MKSQTILLLFESRKLEFDLFRRKVVSALECEPSLNTGSPPVIHSVKSRLVDDNYLGRLTTTTLAG